MRRFQGFLDGIGKNGDSAARMALTEYPGGKNGAGVFQAIIAQMPPHETYIEPFLGSGAILRRKKPALRSFGLDLAADVVAQFPRREVPGAIVIHGDGVAFLQTYPWTGRECVYCDPPYPMETRSSAGRIYAHEWTEKDHAVFLAIAARIPAPVIISSYRSALYSQALSKWRVVTFWTTNRAGRRVQEQLYCNFSVPVLLHDYQFTGGNFRERERIKRKRLRWARRLRAMPAWERGAIMEALETLHGSGERLTIFSDGGTVAASK